MSHHRRLRPNSRSARATLPLAVAHKAQRRLLPLANRDSRVVALLVGGGAHPVCQICSKVGHVASCCFKRFKKNFLGAGNDGRNMDHQLAALIDGSTTAAYHVGGSTSSYPVDPYWYVDIAATNHFSNDLNELTVKEQYHGKDTIQTANGAGMRITHIGQSIIPTYPKPLHLKIFIMYHQLLATYSLSNVLHLIITSSLNSIHGIFSLRTGILGSFFLEGDLTEAFIIFLHQLSSMPSAASSCRVTCGTRV
jgi:hypothetical protein